MNNLKIKLNLNPKNLPKKMLLLNLKNLLMLVNSLKSTLPQLFSLTQSALMPKKTSETVTPPTETLFLLESQFTKELTKKPEEFSTIPPM